MKSLFFVFLLLCLSCPLFPCDKKAKPQEISAGASLLLYQSVFSFQESAGVEVAYKSQIMEQLDWQIGARLGISPVHPEAFVRLLIVPKFQTWKPMVGLECGVTTRAHFDEGDKLLRETRQAMEDDISPVYIACYAAPLSFQIKKNWSLSLLELTVGTHLVHMGRTVRVQVGLFTLGRSL